jgi:hypothetical protein
MRCIPNRLNKSAAVVNINLQRITQIGAVGFVV